ncbi:hypothetical protein F2Q69_00060355 [Brassica cretica]|uniref:Uncharacterized protein n=1 Tax=Brassica cretica TaxID=69181 RepID=A0A8S9RQQ9_BRACR|nr:hypothetical protein F2Q69_00060355 [Brassica cretica]
MVTTGLSNHSATLITPGGSGGAAAGAAAGARGAGAGAAEGDIKNILGRSSEISSERRGRSPERRERGRAEEEERNGEEEAAHGYKTSGPTDSFRRNFLGILISIFAKYLSG